MGATQRDADLVASFANQVQDAESSVGPPLEDEEVSAVSVEVIDDESQEEEEASLEESTERERQEQTTPLPVQEEEEEEVDDNEEVAEGHPDLD